MPETGPGTQGDEFTGQMMGSINSIEVEMMSAISCKDCEQRNQRQAQGIEKAKAEGKYQMRPVEADLHKRIRASEPVAAAGVRKLRYASRGVSGEPQ